MMALVSAGSLDTSGSVLSADANSESTYCLMYDASLYVKCEPPPEILEPEATQSLPRKEEAPTQRPIPPRPAQPPGTYG